MSRHRHDLVLEVETALRVTNRALLARVRGFAIGQRVLYWPEPDSDTEPGEVTDVDFDGDELRFSILLPDSIVRVSTEWFEFVDVEVVDA